VLLENLSSIKMEESIKKMVMFGGWYGIRCYAYGRSKNSCDWICFVTVIISLGGIWAETLII